MKIKFYCRSFNKELYLLSKGLYEQAGYPCVRLTDQSADGYFYTMLNDADCDIAINVDEDCFIANLDAVLALAGKAADEGWVNIGCSDAALGCPRGGNAMVTNPFFNIFNLRLIRQRWNRSEAKHFDYAAVRERLSQDFMQHGPKSETIRQDLQFQQSGAEPYYNFFFWMLSTFPGRTLYLDNRRHPDRISTLLYAPDGQLLCSHSWFARQFHPSFLTRLFEGNDCKDINHARRIDSLIREVYAERGLTVPQLSGMQKFGCRLDEAVRWTVKIPQRIANWPHKLMKIVFST